MIYYVTEKKCYHKYSTAMAIDNFCKINNIKNKPYTLEDFKNHNIEKDESSNILFIADAAFLKCANGTNFIKEKMPHAKIIVIGSDSIGYLHTGIDEFPGIENVYLYLDTMRWVVDHYTSKGILSDIYFWSYSEKYIENADIDIDYEKKKYDTVCLMSCNKNYRVLLSQFLLSRCPSYISNESYSGGTLNYNENTLRQDIINLYQSSWTVLGTTSPAWSDTRTMKGFRDFLAPFFGSLLIYDNHPQILEEYNINNCIPIYDYENFNTILELIEKIKTKDYKELVENQKKEFKNFSIEEQLKKLFNKYDFFGRV